jgi:hypothetical protein
MVTMQRTAQTKAATSRRVAVVCTKLIATATSKRGDGRSAALAAKNKYRTSSRAQATEPASTA